MPSVSAETLRIYFHVSARGSGSALSSLAQRSGWLSFDLDAHAQVQIGRRQSKTIWTKSAHPEHIALEVADISHGLQECTYFRPMGLLLQLVWRQKGPPRALITPNFARFKEVRFRAASCPLALLEMAFTHMTEGKCEAIVERPASTQLRSMLFVGVNSRNLLERVASERSDVFDALESASADDTNANAV